MKTSTQLFINILCASLNITGILLALITRNTVFGIMHVLIAAYSFSRILGIMRILDTYEEKERADN